MAKSRSHKGNLVWGHGSLDMVLRQKYNAQRNNLGTGRCEKSQTFIYLKKKFLDGNKGIP